MRNRRGPKVPWGRTKPGARRATPAAGLCGQPRPLSPCLVLVVRVVHPPPPPVSPRPHAGGLPSNVATVTLFVQPTMSFSPISVASSPSLDDEERAWGISQSSFGLGTKPHLHGNLMLRGVLANRPHPSLASLDQPRLHHHPSWHHNPVVSHQLQILLAHPNLSWIHTRWPWKPCKRH